MFKIKKLISVLLFTIFVIGFYLLFGVYSKTKYSNLIISEENWNSIIDSRKMKEELLISDIEFNNFELVYDKANKVYFYSMIKDEKGYKPRISYHKDDEKIKVAFKRYIDDELIEKNQKLEMLIYNDNDYNVINIVCTKLPILTIDYDELITNETYVTMNMYLYDNRKDIVKRDISSSGNIRYRGVTALNYDKKGYRFNLVDNNQNNHISLLGMRKDDDWILYAAYNDQEKIRNVFSTRLWYECCRGNNTYKVANSMQYKYVELFMNGEYNGLYALGYPIDEKSLGASEDDYMFKKKSWEQSELNELDENGKMLGYDIKNQVADPNFGYNKLNEYYKVISSDDKDAIYNMIDVNNSIDIYIFYNFVQGSDNISEDKLKNTYITLKKSNNGMKAIYTPWDLDLTFGNEYSDKDGMFTDMYEKDPTLNNVMTLNPIARLKELDSSISKTIYERYAYLRKRAWSNENINILIDEYEKDIYNSGAFLRDKERWENGYYNDENIKLEEFRNYIMLRLHYMDKYMEDYIGYSNN